MKEAILFYQQANDEHGLCRAFSHLANTYLFIKGFENARLNYQKALEVNQLVKDKEAAWFANGGLAKCYYQLKKYEPVLEHFEAYFDVIKEIERSFYEDCFVASLLAMTKQRYISILNEYITSLI
jgi:tetratricopeptide (TPR) repeat protein